MEGAPLLRTGELQHTVKDHSMRTEGSDSSCTLRPSSRLVASANGRPSERLVTPFPGFLDRGKGSFLHRLLDCHGRESRSKVFGTIIAAAVVEHKWRRSAKNRFWRETAVYGLSLAAAVAATFLAEQQPLVLSVLLALLGLHALNDLRVDAVMCWTTGLRQHADDLFNWLRLGAAAAAVVATVTHFAQLDADDDTISTTALPAALAVLVYCKWIGLYYYLQPHSEVGPVIRMIVAIIFDIRCIALAMLIAILALSNALFTLLDNEDAAVGFLDPVDAIYTTYKMLLLVAFDDEGFAIGGSSSLIRVLFVVTSALGPVVLLNLLIARMSDAYERIQDEAEMERRRLQAQISLKCELLAGDAGGPQWLHVVVPRGQNKAKVDKREWAGVLNDVKERLGEKIEQSEEKMNVKMAEVKEEVAEMKKEINVKMAEMKKEMTEMKKEMNGKLDRIIAGLAKTSGADADALLGFPSN